ncbi:MAG TPA: signal recognition particle-docking protein FtsY [candidate division WOR-3 bacterium]|uniref:Signal recognition particle receptor FtsY n=1 Tax=candidate division WOR-3 bacterium TaxID=2052148 RepID=A0A7V0T7H8_UNCW3|nr:signal recognition particle-docking protein FtsY [candidate division WOR-3 bacterium]
MSALEGIGRGLRRLASGLARTRSVFRRLLSAESDEELEELLLGADVGSRATELLLDKVRGVRPAERGTALEAEIARLLSAGGGAPPAAARPAVILIVGVNGSGKTTTTGKLCYRLRREGKRVVLAAADTYRDAAAEQLAVWAERAGVELVSSRQGQDAAAVAFDAVRRAQSRDDDFVIVDTAGRLHTRTDLMQEADKIKRVLGRVRPGAPEETLLVLDATVGQNGLAQARAFNEQLGLTGLIVAKLDGTARGGVLIAIALELGLPIRYVGTGETLEDLEPFDPAAYARALFEGD